MLNFEEIAEISYRINVLGQMIIFGNGMIVNSINYAEFIQNTFDT